MQSAQEIAVRFREVILDGTWIANTNFKHQLAGTSWEIATAKVSPFNTIAALAQHIHYYIAGIKNVFKGGTLNIHDKYSFNFPPVESQEQWDDVLTRFWDEAEEFAVLVEQMTEERLKDVFVDARYGTYQRNIEAMIEHSYYHLGQIVLLKKMLANDK